MTLNWKKMLIFISRRIWFLVAVVLVLTAILVSLGRSAIDELDRYRQPLNQFVSDMLGARFEAAHVSGEWRRLAPTINLSDVRILGESGRGNAIALSELRIKPNLLQTLLKREFVWSELNLGKLALTLEEDEEGRWKIADLPLIERSSEQNIFELLLRSRHLFVDEATVTLSFYSGTRTTLNASGMLLEKSGDFYRLQANMGVGEKTDSARLVLEGKSKNYDYRHFVGTGYLTLETINFSGALNAIVKNWFPELVERIGEIETKLDAQAWFDMNGIEDIEWTGRVSAAEIPMNWLAEANPITDFNADVTGWIRVGESWGLRWQGVDFSWPGIEVEPLNLVYTQQTGDDWGNGKLAVEHINLVSLSKLLQKARLAPDKVLTVLEELNPKGMLRAIQLGVSLDNGGVPQIDFRANLEDVEISSWRGGPASRGINGYVEAGNTSGLVELDSQNGFAMHYPKSYENYMEHSTIRGQVRWLLDRETNNTKVSTGLISVGGEEGDGHAYLYLDLTGGDERSDEMYLLAGVKGMHSSYRNRYIPNKLSKPLRTWLNEAVGDMSLAETGFVWRGSLSKEDSDRSVQLHIDVRDGELKFQPDWMPLEQLNAVVAIDNGSTSGVLESAIIGGINLHSGQFDIPFLAGRDSLQLEFDAKVTGDASDAMSVLYNSPLQQKMTAFRDWQATGDVGMTLDLSIPLRTGANDGRYQVDVKLNGNRLANRSETVVFERLKGSLQYHNIKGVSADKVSGLFWGQPLMAKIVTHEIDGQQQVAINSRGVLAAERLSDFLSVSDVDLLSGGSAFQGAMTLPLQSTSGTVPQLEIKTNLRGMAIELPAPFGKAETEVLETGLNIRFEDNLLVSLQLGEPVQAQLEMRDGAVGRGLVALNQATAELPESQEKNQLLVQGSLSEISLSDWQAVYERLQNSAAFKSSTDSHLVPVLDLKFEQLDVERFTLQDVALKGVYARPQWQLAITSDLADGDIIVEPEAEIPLALHLSRLSLPASDDTTDISSLDPATLPLIDFAVDDFSAGDVHYGSAAFRILPQPTGALFTHIQTNQRGLRFGGSDQQTVDTQMEWLLEDGKHNTRFEGVIRADNVANVLAARGLPKILDSKKAFFLADLNWAGHPLAINSETVRGSLALELKGGRFYTTPKGPTNALVRIIGLVNFANWTRRLKLDFSDLFDKGMSYDSMRGGLYFDQGVMKFDPPMVVEMPSGRMRLVGEANLMQETIDAKLVTTLPVGTNLPWLAALAGGLPAAAGVYITGKIFDKEVDKLSSFGYSIEGDWDEPEIQVDKIFSDSLKRSDLKQSEPSGGEQ